MYIKNKLGAALLVAIIMFNVIVSSFLASGTDIMPEIVIEEGWRYHKSLKLTLTHSPAKSLTVDLLPEHQGMAKTLDSTTKKDKDPKKVEYACLLRFMPIFYDSGKEALIVGSAIILTDPISLKTQTSDLVQPYEVGFMSGSCPEKGAFANNIKKIDLTLYGEKRKGIFGLRPPCMNEKNSIGSFFPFAVCFFQRFYINHQVLKQTISFRFPENLQSSRLTGQSYELVRAPYLSTIKKIMEHEENLSKTLDTVKKEAFAHSMSYAMRDILLVMKKSREFSDNPAVNSFTCAEQVALEYLRDIEILKGLQQKLRVGDDGFRGIIVNVHCTHTPCFNCAVSLSRESETGGIFNLLANKRPVVLFCSYQTPYKRKEPMPTYTKKCTEKTLSANIEVNLQETSLNPYPIVPVSFVPESGVYGIDPNNWVDHMRKSFDQDRVTQEKGNTPTSEKVSEFKKKSSVNEIH